MKKIIAILSVSMLAACVYAGNVDILSSRNKLFEVWQTEKIFYYDNNQGQEVLSESKTITEDKIEKGQVLVTKTGDVMAFSKTYRTDFYGSEALQINKNAVMSSSYSPLYIKKGTDFEGFGETRLNGIQYMLVRQKGNSDVLLVDGDGQIFSRIGRIVNGRLAILDIEFFVEPQDARFTPIVKTRSDVTDVMNGFELVYGGVVNNNMRFIFVTLGQDGKSEEMTFPLEETTIEINGLRINVIEAGYNKIEYVIL